MPRCCQARVAAGSPNPITSEKHVVASPTSRSENPKTVKLSFLDQITAPYMVIRLPFLYAYPLHKERLIASLRLALERLPLFAGRAVKDSDGDYAVVLNGAGASIAFASSQCRIADLVPRGMYTAGNGNDFDPGIGTRLPPPTATFEPADFSPFLPDGPAFVLGYLGKDVPLVQAKVTHLADGGTCLTVAIPHLLADLDTCKTVIATWASEYRALSRTHSSDEIQPGFNRPARVSGVPSYASTGRGDDDASARSSSLKDVLTSTNSSQTSIGGSQASKRSSSSSLIPLLADLLGAYAAPALPADYESPSFEKRRWTFLPAMIGSVLWHVGGSGGIDTVAYHIPASRLSELKKEASRQLTESSASSSGAWISTNDALVARLWQVLAQLPHKSECQVFLSINLRRRLVPTLPANSLGNCAWSLAAGGAEGRVKHPARADLGSLAVATRSAIQSMDRDLISREFAWLQSNVKGAASLPVVVKGAENIIKVGGNIMVSNWDWDKDYASVSFADDIREGAPVWHQPFLPRTPNCAFIVPAPSAAPGGGAMIFLSIHKSMAKVLRKRFPVL